MNLRISNRAHFSPVSAVPTIIAVLFSAVVLRGFLSGAVPGTITLWAFALVVGTAQAFNVVYDGMTPLNFPGVAVGGLYSIFLIKTLLGHFAMSNFFFYVIPVMIVLFLIQAAVG